MNTRLILRALRSRNYRLFFTGQLVSLVGTWMQNVAMSWMVYRLTGSAFMLGAVSFSGDIFAFLLMPFGGVLADRLDRRRMLICLQTLMMLQALVLSVLVLSDVVRVWHIIALAMVLGALNAFDMPIRQAFVIEMLEEKSDLPNAIALNSSVFNGARLLGPSLAGVIIAAVGEGYCFLLNGISYSGVILALIAMRLPLRKVHPAFSDGWSELRVGFAYTFGFLPLRNIIMLVSVSSLMGFSYVVLMPIIARDTLLGGPKILGFLMGTAGLGALVSAFYMAARRNIRGLSELIPLSSATFGAALIALSFSHSFYLSLPVMFFIGLGLTAQMACSNTLIQTIVEDDKRGRVMGIYAMAFRGLSPFGSLLAGGLASNIGALNTLLVGGSSVILAAMFFARQLPRFRKMIRPIYLREGIAFEEAFDKPAIPPSGFPGEHP
jgi:MFS family permease